LQTYDVFAFFFMRKGHDFVPFLGDGRPPFPRRPEEGHVSTPTVFFSFLRGFFFPWSTSVSIAREVFYSGQADLPRSGKILSSFPCRTNCRERYPFLCASPQSWIVPQGFFFFFFSFLPEPCRAHPFSLPPEAHRDGVGFNPPPLFFPFLGGKSGGARPPPAPLSCGGSDFSFLFPFSPCCRKWSKTQFAPNSSFDVCFFVPSFSSFFFGGKKEGVLPLSSEGVFSPAADWGDFLFFFQTATTRFGLAYTEEIMLGCAFSRGFELRTRLFFFPLFPLPFFPGESGAGASSPLFFPFFMARPQKFFFFSDETAPLCGEAMRCSQNYGELFSPLFFNSPPEPRIISPPRS